MINDILQAFENGLGLEADSLSLLQMSLRATIVFILAIIMVRMGKKRFIGRNSAFDIILAIMLGSILSRAVTGSSEFIPTIGAAFVLVGLHWLMAFISFKTDWFGNLVKGRIHILVQNGEIDWDEMRKALISRKDLETAMREQGYTDLEKVREACLERNGNISVTS